MSERIAVVDAEHPPDSPGVGQQRPILSIDQLLDVLASNYRRRIVRQLSDGSASTLDSLVTSITGARMDDRSMGEAPDYESTRIALCHSHLPKLVDSDVIAFDRETETIASGPQLRTATTVLDAIENTRTH